MKLSIVYVLSNPAMPGMVKIGKTERENVNIRMTELYSTGVPLPFKVEFACLVEDSQKVERAFHTAFAPYRVNPKREFFNIDSAQAIVLMELLNKGDQTSTFTSLAPQIEKSEKAAAERFSKRRPNLNFTEMQIPIGSILTSTATEATVVVIEPKKVTLNNEKMSLTAATRQALALDYSVAPGPYWRFEDKLISEIYEETYSEEN